MPIYEYECSSCGRFEVIQKFSDKELKSCPNCKEKGKESPVTKAVSASAFHLKGGGWYKTDYASSNKNSSGSGKPASSSSEGSTSTDSSSTGGESKKAGCGTGCGCH